MNIKKLIDLFCLILPIVSFLFCLLKGYTILSFMPLVFLIIYIIFIRSLYSTSIKITFYILMVFNIIRMVIIPFIISVKSDFFIDNVRLGRENINSGIYLTIYEFIIVSLIFYFINLKINNNSPIVDRNKKYTIYGSKYIYILLSIFGILILFLNPEVRNTISFLIIKSTDGSRLDENINLNTLILRQFVLISIVLLFIVVSNFYYRLYKVNQKLIYILIPLCLGMFNVGIIVGERRSLQIYTLIITIILLLSLFKKHGKFITYSLLVVGLFVLLGMTVYKEFYAFQGGYSEAIQNNLENGDFQWTDRLQAYFYGIHTVAANIDIINYVDTNFYQFFYDNIRSVIGSSLLINSDSLLMSQIYNHVLFGPGVDTGQLFSSIGYGSIFFGVLLSPVVTSINIIACIVFELLFLKSNYIDVKYLLGFIVLRIAFNIYSSSPPIINQVTLFAFPFILILLFSRFIKISLTSKEILK